MTAVPAPASLPNASEHGRHYTNAYLFGMVFLMTLISVIAYIDRVVLGMLVKPIRADLHITDTEFSYLTGPAFALFYTTAGIPLGWVSDRFSRRALISAGCAAWSFMTAACGLTSTYSALFLCRVGVGIGEATLQPSAYPLIGGSFPRNRVARATSVYTMGHPIGAGLAMVISGSVIGALSASGTVAVPLFGDIRPWQLVFLIVGLPGLLLALIAAIYLRDPPKRANAAPQPSFRQVCAFMWRERRAYGTFAVALGFVNAFNSGGLVWFPAFLMRVHGYSPGRAGIFVGLASAVGGIAGSLMVGWYADHIVAKGRRDIGTRVLIPVAIGAFIFAALGPIVPIPWISLTMFSFFGLFMLSGLSGFHAIRQAITPVQMGGQVTAILLCISNLIGLGLGPTSIALCTDYVFHDDNAVNYSIALVGGVCMTITILALWYGRKVHEERFGNPAPV